MPWHYTCPATGPGGAAILRPMRTTIPMALAAVLVAAPLTAAAGKPTVTPLKARVFGTVVDEHKTVDYFHDGGITGCPNPPEIDAAGIVPDGVAEVTSAWNVAGWTSFPGLTAGIYDNGTFCASASSCLRSEFNSSDKTLSIDTRTTAVPQRKFTIDLRDAWDLVNDRPITNVPAVGQIVTTPGLFEVLGSSSLATMAVCSTRACFEAREYPAKFWFADGAGVTWRVDWRHMRVLRVATDTWYFIADACDGSQVAGLSKLEGSRTRPRETNQGYFLVPFLISVKR